MSTLSLSKETKDAMAALKIKEFPFSANDLRDAFKSLAKKAHPDKEGGSKDAFLLLKRQFDRLKPLVDVAGVVIEGEKDPSAVYEACNRCNGTRGKMVSRPAFSQMVDCPDCTGKGYVPVECDKCDDEGKFALKERPCTACDENGMFVQKCGRQVVCRICGGKKVYQPKVVCRKCKGKKVLNKPYCKTCKGTGKVPTMVDIWDPCDKCKGVGEVKLELFNPVLTKAGILV